MQDHDSITQIISDADLRRRPAVAALAQHATLHTLLRMAELADQRDQAHCPIFIVSGSRYVTSLDGAQ